VWVVSKTNAIEIEVRLMVSGASATPTHTIFLIDIIIISDDNI
jgi:hypothetical protein